MGGCGSGRHGRITGTPKADWQPAIDISELKRFNVLTSDQVGLWSHNKSERPIMIVAAWMADEQIELSVNYVTSVGWNKARAKVALTWSDCNYGGKGRPWFLCPGTGSTPCGRRVGKLYAFRASLLCRHCCGLVYKSQYEPYSLVCFTELHKAQAILKRLGGSGNLAEKFPCRPKGMQHVTYEALYYQMCRYLNRFANVLEIYTEKSLELLYGIREVAHGCEDIVGYQSASGQPEAD